MSLVRAMELNHRSFARQTLGLPWTALQRNYSCSHNDCNYCDRCLRAIILTGHSSTNRLNGAYPFYSFTDY